MQALKGSDSEAAVPTGIPQYRARGGPRWTRITYLRGALALSGVLLKVGRLTEPPVLSGLATALAHRGQANLQVAVCQLTSTPGDPGMGARPCRP